MRVFIAIYYKYTSETQMWIIYSTLKYISATQSLANVHDNVSFSYPITIIVTKPTYRM